MGIKAQVQDSTDIHSQYPFISFGGTLPIINPVDDEEERKLIFIKRDSNAGSECNPDRTSVSCYLLS